MRRKIRGSLLNDLCPGPEMSRGRFSISTPSKRLSPDLRLHGITRDRRTIFLERKGPFASPLKQPLCAMSPSPSTLIYGRIDRWRALRGSLSRAWNAPPQLNRYALLPLARSTRGELSCGIFDGDRRVRRCLLIERILPQTRKYSPGSTCGVKL